LEKEDPDVNLSAAERPIGGLGIFLTKEIMDHVSYEYKNGQNFLTLTKKLKG
jgi:anti-sigma regulatory factor (Ser/Thr protein kinase)